MYPKELKARSQKDIHRPMCMAASFTTAKRWKQSMCPSMDELISKMWYICTMEYDSSIKRKEFEHMVQYGWTSKSFSSVKSDRHKKTNSAWFHLHVILRVVKLIEAEGSIVLVRDVCLSRVSFERRTWWAVFLSLALLFNRYLLGIFRTGTLAWHFSKNKGESDESCLQEE